MYRNNKFVQLIHSHLDTLGADKKTIIVENSGRISDPQGKVNDIEGTAVRPDDHEPGKLIVNFPSSPSPQSTKPNCKYEWFFDFCTS